jgi:hypothetical protein
MPKVLLPADLLTLNQLLMTGGTKGLYTSLASRGYSYAHWAGGVAYAMGMPTIASADYVRGTALLAIASPIFRMLRPAQVDKLRFDIAKAYLRTLHRIMRGHKMACVDRDLTVSELCELYSDGLERNGLSVENWNLHFPLTILRRLSGADALAEFWNFLRDSRRRPVHIGTLTNLAVLAFIYKHTSSTDIKCRQMASAWLSRNPTVHTRDDIEKKFRTARLALRAAAPADLIAFLTLLEPEAAAWFDHGDSPVQRTLLTSRTAIAPAPASTDGGTDAVPDPASAAVYEALIRRLTSQ